MRRKGPQLARVAKSDGEKSEFAHFESHTSLVERIGLNLSTVRSSTPNILEGLSQFIRHCLPASPIRVQMLVPRGYSRLLVLIIFMLYVVGKLTSRLWFVHT